MSRRASKYRGFVWYDWGGPGTKIWTPGLREISPGRANRYGYLAPKGSSSPLHDAVGRYFVDGPRQVNATDERGTVRFFPTIIAAKRWLDAQAARNE